MLGLPPAHPPRPITPASAAPASAAPASAAPASAATPRPHPIPHHPPLPTASRPPWWLPPPRQRSG
jgi:hypothetical protein